MVEKRDKNTIGSLQNAVWPDDAPYPLEETVLSIVCGNTHMHWAMHGSRKELFAPILFWRTPPLNEDERKDEPCTVLARHLPSQAHAFVFGNVTAPGTKKSANATKAERNVPAVSIYVISTNTFHEEALEFLFSDIAVRLVKLQSKDFYTNEQGSYGTIGTDRVAAMKAGEKLYGAPLMVMDAGTAWTYTAMDRSQTIIGGGIGPGLFSRFRCLSDYCDALPMIDYEKYDKAILEAIEKNNPLPVFARDTEKGMIVSCVSEVGNQARSLVKHFLAKVGTNKGNSNSTTTTNNNDKESAAEEGNYDDDDDASKPTIVLTGGDAVFLNRVLEKSSSQLLGCEPGSELPAGDYHIYVMKHLVHYGIGHMLNDKPVRELNDPDDILREKLVNLRVAKYFKQADEDGDHFFRGSIIKVARGANIEGDYYYVKYDDGDAEQCEIHEVHAMLTMYQEKGEKSGRGKWKETKKEEAKAAAAKISERDGLRDKIEEEKKKMLKIAAQAASRKRNASSGDGPNKKPKTSKEKKDKKKKDKGNIYMKKRIAKAFEQEGEDGRSITEIFFGTIDRLSSKPGELPLLWHVLYDDNDEEEFDEKDIKVGLQLYEANQKSDPKRVDDKKTASVEVVPAAAAAAATDKPAPMDVDEPEKDKVVAAPGATAADENSKPAATTAPPPTAEAGATTSTPSTTSAPAAAAAAETKEAPKPDTAAKPAADSSAPAQVTKPAETANEPPSSSEKPGPTADATDAKADGEPAANGDKPAASAAAAEGA